ncbi:MAG: hypothetical protein MZW92_14265 [Comamonadaceae bacterium]|nr:hypothetical protein [Comamonadaceae bacterium]
MMRGAAGAAHAGRQRAGGAGRLQRVPAARAGARQPAPHVHRHADAGADPGRVRRGAAGHRCWATSSRRPLLLLADGVRQVAAGDLTAKPVFASRRRARRPDAQRSPT